MMPLYAAVGGLAVLITLSPWLLTLLPTRAEVPAGPPATTTPELSASSVTSFDQSSLVVVADQPLKLSFNNTQAGVPHDVAIFPPVDASAPPLFHGEAITGPASIVYDVPPLAAGEYRFQCTIHPPMVGTLIARA
jgi:hypothetical protein